MRPERPWPATVDREDGASRWEVVKAVGEGVGETAGGAGRIEEWSLVGNESWNQMSDALGRFGRAVKRATGPEAERSEAEVN